MKSSAKISLIGIFLFSLFISGYSMLNIQAQSIEKAVISEDTIRIQTGLGTPIIDLQLIENTDHCLVDCYAILRYHPYENVQLPESENSEFRWDFIKESPYMAGLSSYSFEILTNVSYKVTVPIHENTSYDCWNNETEQYGTCWRMEQTGSRTETRYKDVYQPFAYWSQLLEADKDYYIKLSGKKKAVLGRNNVDWVPTIKGIALSEWAPWYGDYTYTRHFRFSNRTSTTLNNFPILVKLNSSNFDFSHVKSDCSDIRFVPNDNETEYKYEIENCSAATEEAWFWVNVTLPADDDFEMWIYYGDDDVNDASDACAVWNSDYKLVYHMNDINTSYINDSTSNDFLGYKKGSNEPIQEVDSKLDVAQDFDGINDWIKTDNTTITGSSPRTMEAWFKLEKTYDHESSQLLANIFGWGSEGSKQMSRLVAWHKAGAGSDTVIGFWGHGSVNHQDLQGSTNLTEDAWYYGAAVYDGSGGLVLYLSGEVDASADSIDIDTTNTIISFAEKIGDPGDRAWYDGDIDEIRLSNVARSSDWIRTTYYSGVQEGIVIGSEESKPCPEPETYIREDTTYSPIICNVGGYGYGVLIIDTSDVTLDCNGMTLNGSEVGIGYGINVMAHNVTVKNCIVEGYAAGIWVNGGANGSTLINNTALLNDYFGIDFLGSTNTDVINSNFTLNGVDDVHMEYSSASFINSTYVKLNIIDSNLSRKWYLRVNVSNETDAIESANVTVVDKFSNEEWMDTTDSQGLTGWHTVTEYVETNTTPTNHTPHTAVASHETYGTGDTTVTVNESMTVDVIIGFHDITFNVTSGEDGTELDNVNIYCNYTNFDQSGNTTNPYGPYPFPQDTWSCTFECGPIPIEYFNKTIIFTADDDKTVNVSMNEKAYLTESEHTWLEYLYNCWSEGNCIDLLNMLPEIEQTINYVNQTNVYINETVDKIWNQVKRTDQSVVTNEEIINKTVDSTSNLTINYTLHVPIKEGFVINQTSGEIRLDYLPIRISYWFLDEDNESCYNQGDYPSGIDKIEPYCQPLTVYTVGQIDSVIDFTVELRPSLPAGTYYIVRNIEVDPEYTWINYGREVIGSVEVLEDSTEASINLENTGTFVQPELTAPLTGLIIGDILTPVNISLVLSMLAISMVGIFSLRNRS